MQPGPQFGYVSPPVPYGWAPARADGAILDVPVHGANLPPICCKCGVRHDIRARLANLTWVHPLAYAGLLGGLLPMLIMVAVMQKRATITLPICGACDRRWTQGVVLRLLAILAPFVLGPLFGVVVGSLSSDGADGILAGLAAFLVLILLVPLLVVKLVSEPRSVTAAKIDDHRARLKGVSRELLRELGATY